MRYAVVYFKGGVGKTTMAVHLASWLQAQGDEVLLIDADPQESATKWAGWRQEMEADLPSPVTVGLRGRAVLEEGKRLANNYAHTVIDVGGRDGPGMRNAMLLADKIIIPVGNSGIETVELVEFHDMLETVRDFNPDVQVKVLLNRVDSRSSTTGLDEFVQSMGYDRFNTIINERRLYTSAMESGHTVFDIKPSDKAVTDKLQALFTEIVQWEED